MSEHLEHSHEHHHEHSHEHSHEHHHEHHHEHAPQAGGTPMEELLALMEYMVNHNAAHTRELGDLAAQLDQAGHHEAYHQVMAALEDYEKGNAQLKSALQELSR